MAPALIPLPKRVYRVSRGTDPLRLTSWEHIRQSLRGRWDDTAEEYRVLYCSSKLLGALVESLQDLRQNDDALRLLSEIEGDDEASGDMTIVARDRLRNRYVAELIPSHPDELVVDVAHGATRTFLEDKLASELTQRKITHLKIGDAIGTDRALSRHISRAFFEAGCNGILAPSAEHAGSKTIAAFETHSVSGRLRVSLVLGSVQLALERSDVAAEALRYLGMIPEAAP